MSLTVLRAAFGLTSLCLPTSFAAAADRPNILFLMADQFRGDCLASAGNTVIQTPNLDRLAHEGIRFDRAYTSTPSCTPARSGLITGLSPWHHGMLGMGQMAEHYPHELPAMLHDAGYATMGIGKMHFYPQRTLHGFDRTVLDESGREQTEGYRSDYRSWFWSVAPTLSPDATGIGWNDYRAKPYVLPEDLHPTRWTADVAIRFLESYKSDRPFFLMVSWERPHSPYDAPERFVKMYENADVPPAAIGDWAGRNALNADPNNHDSWHGDFGPRQVLESRRSYYGSISFVDEQIGRILAVLQSRGWLDNTLILFTADHGDMIGDHHLWRKTYAYEGSSRIPLLVRWPESVTAHRGQAVDLPVELRDVLPTFLDAAGAPASTGTFDGRSLLDLVRGATKDWRSYIDLEHSVCYSGSEPWNALTDGKEKYILYGASGREELFDLRTDPRELHNLSSEASQARTLATWRERMVKHLSERGNAFIKDGRFVIPRQNMLYSPNFPNSADGPPKKRRAAGSRPN